MTITSTQNPEFVPKTVTPIPGKTKTLPKTAERVNFSSVLDNPIVVDIDEVGSPSRGLGATSKFRQTAIDSLRYLKNHPDEAVRFGPFTAQGTKRAHQMAELFRVSFNSAVRKDETLATKIRAIVRTDSGGAASYVYITLR